MNLVVSFRRVSPLIFTISLLLVSLNDIGPFNPAQSVAAMFADVFVPQASGYVLV